MDDFRQLSHAQKVSRAISQGDLAHEQEAAEPWKEALNRSLISAKDLDSLKIIPRVVYMDPWLKEGDLGFIFATRGLGKTWIGIHLANCLAEGRLCGPWNVVRPIKVLYMDGEMPLQDVQYRNHLLSNCTENLSYLSHELLFERTGRILNLADTELQKAVIELINNLSYKVLILDNLSTLVTGIEENKAIDWEKILPWLLQLRRAHITVIFIHHAGRNGMFMRGTTKREDAATWVIGLKAPRNDPEKELPGASFISSFEKCRNGASRPKDIQWNFKPLPNGEMDVSYEVCTPLHVFLELVESGISQPKDIAQEMEISGATVTRLAQKAERNGLIAIRKRQYFINDSERRVYNPSED